MTRNENVIIPIKVGKRTTKVEVARHGNESLTSRILDACNSAFGPGRLQPDGKKKVFKWVKDKQ